MRRNSILILLMLVTCWCRASETKAIPVWDLSKNEILSNLQIGLVQKVGGTVRLENGAAFAIPAQFFPDPQNFTVQITLEIPTLVNNTVFTVMKKQGTEDNGFSCAFNYCEQPTWARHLFAVVNNVFMEASAPGGRNGPLPNTSYTFTVAIRNKYASFYVDDKPYKKCYMEMIPNTEPLWIGKKNLESDQPMSVILRSVKVYGADYIYVSANEPTTEFPRGVVAGHGWALDIPEIIHPEWRKVLIYGDSISMGYREYLIPDLLKQQIYVFHCCHFVNGDTPHQALIEIASRYKFDVVVFNNGLHSLHWTPDKVSDELVQSRMRDMAYAFHKGAPQAKIFYLLTTPYTSPRTIPEHSFGALGDKNDIVLRLNKLTVSVMQKENIPVIDVYTPLSNQLKLANGDGYHWQNPAYKMISDEIQKKILPIQ